jgi:hypothetical protein
MTSPTRASIAAAARKAMGVAAAVLAIAVATAASISPPAAPTAADHLATYIRTNSQTLDVDPAVPAAEITRGDYSATAGYPTLAAEGTNYAWAKMVLLAGGWPQSAENQTVLLRWMRQENGADNWFNRNNPLNNGWGSGGGGGTGRYASLVVAAQKAAEALVSNRGYSQIVANLAASSPTAVTEAAIWASPWASGHYANGDHWHYTEVPVVSAPASAWG